MSFFQIIFNSEYSYLFYSFLALAFGGYGVLAGGSYWYFYVLHKDTFLSKKIQKVVPTRREILHEIRWSLSSICVWVVVAALVIYAGANGWTFLYFDIGKYDIPYFFVSIVLLIVLHDTYFYWTHRFMHSTEPVYYFFHATHHQSKNPTPLAIYSFGPFEALLYALYIPLVISILPIHVYALLVWIFIEAILNCLGHLGYEVFPSWVFQTRWGWWINSAILHNLHHQESRSGYGHYFNFWDSLMKTNTASYRRTVEAFYK